MIVLLLMDKGKNFRKYFYLSSIGIEMGVATMIGVGMGWLIDKYIFGDKYSPLFTLIFLFFGFAAGIKNVIKLIKSLGKDNNGSNE